MGYRLPEWQALIDGRWCVTYLANCSAAAKLDLSAAEQWH
jgi:hypothetical protein